jgi:UDP-2,3-diacylglucosamine pyrophosphatase LpxH
MRRPDYIHAALTRLFESPDLLSIPIENRKIVIISDFHLGDCSKADNFYPNRKIARDLLTYYGKKGYFLIINGDFEELWQFSAAKIRSSYKTLYSLIRRLYPGKIFRIYGNHDEPDLLPEGERGGLPGLMILRGEKRPFLVTHGHLGSTESDLYGWFSKICVALFRIIEPFLIYIRILRPPQFRTGYFHDFEYIHEAWARKNHCLLICGHSHRAVFASRSHYQELKQKMKGAGTLKDKMRYSFLILKEILRKQHITFKENDKPFYFNCGCGIYKRGITAIELDEKTINLVKWDKSRRHVYHQAFLKDL